MRTYPAGEMKAWGCEAAGQWPAFAGTDSVVLPAHSTCTPTVKVVHDNVLYQCIEMGCPSPIMASHDELPHVQLMVIKPSYAAIVSQATRL